MVGIPIREGDIVRDLSTFQFDASRHELTFPSSLTSEQRALVHRLSSRFGLSSRSLGHGQERFVVVSRNKRFQELEPNRRRSLASIVASDESGFSLDADADATLARVLRHHPFTDSDRALLQPISAVRLGKVKIEKIGRLQRTKPRVPDLRVDDQHPVRVTARQLPIWSHKERICAAVDTGQVTIITGETGCGKTTQVPQLIMELCAERREPCNLVVTQPRRLPAVAVARRVAEEIQQPLGQTVGYHIRLESRCSSETQLMYCTSGVLLRTLTDNEEALSSLSHIFLDEVHEREKLTDFLLVLLRERLPRFPRLRLVLMSATMEDNLALFQSYFHSAVHVHVPGRQFSVREFHLEDVLRMTGFEKKAQEGVFSNFGAKTMSDLKNGTKEKKIEEEGRESPDVIELSDSEESGPSTPAPEAQRSDISIPPPGYANSSRSSASSPLGDFGKPVDGLESVSEEELLSAYGYGVWYDKVDMELLLALLVYCVDCELEGAVLVFLPGYEDIMMARDALERSEQLKACRMTPAVFLLHSQMTGDQEAVFEPSPSGVRKIILSTNIAETSITIGDVAIVVDSGLVKERQYDSFHGISSLRQVLISKSNAEQRKGRAGRCRSGVCVRLYSRETWESMAKSATPQMLREPIHELCLQARLIVQLPTTLLSFLQKAPQPPPYDDVINSIDLLKSIEALNEKEELTELGRVMAEFPMEPQLSILLIHGLMLCCLDPVLSLVAALSYRDPYLLPSKPKEKEIVESARKELAGGHYSDHWLLLRLCMSYEETRGMRFRSSLCNRYGLSLPVMEMICGIKKHLVADLTRLGILGDGPGRNDWERLNRNSNEWVLVKAAVAAGSYPCVAFVNPENGKIKTGKVKEARLHPSCIFRSGLGRDKEEGPVRVRSSDRLPSSYLVYQEMTQSTYGVSIRMVTCVSPLTIALFAGPLRLPPSSISQILETEDDSAEGTESNLPMKATVLEISDKLVLKLPVRLAKDILSLRMKWGSRIVRGLEQLTERSRPEDETLLDGILQLLKSDEPLYGFQNAIEPERSLSDTSESSTAVKKRAPKPMARGGRRRGGGAQPPRSTPQPPPPAFPGFTASTERGRGFAPRFRQPHPSTAQFSAPPGIWNRQYGRQGAP